MFSPLRSWIAAWVAGGQLAAVGGQLADSQTAYLTSFQTLSPGISKAEFAEQWKRYGIVMLGFEDSPGFLEHAFPKMDGFMQDHKLVRHRISASNNVSANPTNTSTGVSPLRIRFHQYSQLAPADETVQGPHQEGASATRGNRRAIAFVCEKPADRDGGTALFDMQRAWELLPADLKARLAGAHWALTQHDESQLLVPAVVRHDLTGQPCLQFYCFGGPARDCVDVYRHRTGRFDARPDPYTYEMHPERDVVLVEANGTQSPFVGLDLYRMLTSVYSAMIAHSWTGGQALLVDNIRWAHARLDGSGPKRKVHFFYYGPEDRSFNLWKLERPSL
uniref:TauD/TfdA-like domain-containing protein n=1 Tax=Alexandrium monilatum TaxID=311494 RepID=A0A7S4UDA3_9DINO